jgi:hypothetical protein
VEALARTVSVVIPVRDDADHLERCLEALARQSLFGSNFAMVRPAWAAARDRVHRHDPKVHNDLDLSFNLDPQTHVLLDRDLRVRVSARPFAHPLGFVWRAWRGIHTVLVNRMPGRRD